MLDELENSILFRSWESNLLFLIVATHTIYVLMLNSITISIKIHVLKISSERV
jgi:hypothetical protein